MASRTELASYEKNWCAARWLALIAPKRAELGTQGRLLS